MYYLKKTVTVSGAHRLDLPYDSPCKNVHGHNWKITVHLKAKNLNANGMILDFCEIKAVINGMFDHKMIEMSQPEINPTAENIAREVCQRIPYCYRVDVEETEGSVASYEIQA